MKNESLTSPASRGFVLRKIESAKFEVQFFVGSSVIKITACV